MGTHIGEYWDSDYLIKLWHCCPDSFVCPKIWWNMIYNTAKAIFVFTHGQHWNMVPFNGCSPIAALKGSKSCINVWLEIHVANLKEILFKQRWNKHYSEFCFLTTKNCKNDREYVAIWYRHIFGKKPLTRTIPCEFKQLSSHYSLFPVCPHYDLKCGLHDQQIHRTFICWYFICWYLQ